MLKRVKLFNFCVLLTILTIAISFSRCNSDDDTNNSDNEGWTVMIYGDGDNDLESMLLLDIEEMADGYVNDENLDIIVLVDRINGESSRSGVFDEDFTDTRLYRINQGGVDRISGGSQFPEITTSSNYEANMGDANTLKKFIQFCKSNYSANHYALVLWNHGGGTRSRGGSDSDDRKYKAVCWDDTDGGDCLYTAEITDVLTPSESVDLIGFDACFMGSVEVAYQYRPGNGGFNAQVMAASPPVEWGYGWDYENIFARIKTGGGNNGEVDTVVGGGSSNELYYDPATMTALEFGGIIVEEQYDSAGSQSEQALSCYDLTKVSAVKSAVDTMASSLWSSNPLEDEKDDFEAIRGSNSSPGTMHYFDASDAEEWYAYPYFDLYDLCERTNESTNFSDTIKNYASSIMSAVDSMIVYSFGGSDYDDFQNGKNGIHIFFPDGDRIFEGYGYRFWRYQWWYNSIDTNDWSNNEGFYYGKLAWCIYGATSEVTYGNSDVENWFEMLDAWFDYTESSWPGSDPYPDGGSNGYKW